MLPAVLKQYGAELTDEGAIKIINSRKDSKLNEIINAIKTSGLEIQDISTIETDLEDVFRQLVRAA